MYQLASRDKTAPVKIIIEIYCISFRRKTNKTWKKGLDLLIWFLKILAYFLIKKLSFKLLSLRSIFSKIYVIFHLTSIYWGPTMCPELCGEPVWTRKINWYDFSLSLLTLISILYFTNTSDTQWNNFTHLS